jgi:2-polyprenyl-3-methyl-5-hydroxy-6-metoxy-1,4-benzoquinol methylase
MASSKTIQEITVLQSEQERMNPVAKGPNGTVASKAGNVAELFNQTHRYLNPRGFDIRIRVETVQHFTQARTFDNILDIGCGDGSLSVPLLERSKRLTLVDLSKNMLQLAQSKVPAERANDVQAINGNVMEKHLPEHSFDLILCVGVLAHADSPGAMIAEIARLARPGALVILEFSDSYHLSGLTVRAYQSLLRLIKKPPYALNRLKRKQVTDWLAQQNLSVTELFRYGIPHPLRSRGMDQESMYSWVERRFGRAGANRSQRLGNEYLYKLTAAE